MKNWFKIIGFGALAVLFSFQNLEPLPKTKLSDFHFFEGKLADFKPSKNVFSYEINTPLFSDYAEKMRFVALPEGEKMRFNPDSAFEFPVGSTLIKTFFYPKTDGSGRRLLETRLLIFEKTGWKAWTYLWNDAQDEAFLEVAGSSIRVERLAADGKKQSFDYAVPNLNQCKGCHASGDRLVPLGLTARQLFSSQSVENQLVTWKKAGRLDGFSEEKSIEPMPDFLDKNAPLDRRARAYLDANCGHCHRPTGSANTSGLFLDWAENDFGKLGVGKAPVAAGRGSGDFQFDIVRGRPEKSILVFRMESLDPGVMMPEMGRSLRHAEGLELVRAWIKSLK